MPIIITAKNRSHASPTKTIIAQNIPIAAVLLAGFASMTGATARPPVLQVFTSVRYSKASGDVDGLEVIVRRMPEHVCVSVQRADGAPGMPHIVAATLQGDSLIFQMPVDDAPPGSAARFFRGRVTKAGLRAEIDGDGSSVWLPRRAHPYFAGSARQLAAARRCG